MIGAKKLRNAASVWSASGGEKRRASKTAILMSTPYTHDNGENPVMAKSHTYVDYWPEAFKRSRSAAYFSLSGRPSSTWPATKLRSSPITVVGSITLPRHAK